MGAWFGLVRVLGQGATGGDGADKPVFWLIPHTHWEGAVFKTREEYLEMGLPNILTAIRLLKEHPNYRFTLDQVAYFRPFLERYPEEAGAFRKFVAEGRLQIVCGLDIMPDDNMPSGESFIRQMLYAKGYVREQLGVDVKVGWLLDTFGHHAQMPQLLKLGGYQSFWFFRGVEDRSKMPSEFLWQGLDGTRIPAFWLPFAYGHLYGPPRDLPHFSSFMRQRWDSLAPFSRLKDRVGLAGVDVSEPETYVPELVEAFNRQTNQPFTLKIGVPTDFEKVASLRSDLPVVSGERNPLFQGIYSSRIELKQSMREGERLLTTAEKLAVLANWSGKSNSPEATMHAWEPALFNVTHDLASGVMTDGVYEDTVASYGFSKRLARELVESRLGEVAEPIDTRGEGIALIVFNTLSWLRNDIAYGDVGFAQGGVNDFELRDAAGRLVPSQIIGTESFDGGGLKRVKFAFVAEEIPAMGHVVYHLIPRGSGSVAGRAVEVSQQSAKIESDFYDAVGDPASGALTSLRLKSDGWEALKAPANVVALEPDKGDFWELYQNLDGGQNTVMKRALNVPEGDKVRLSTAETTKEGRLRRGPVFTEMEVSHPLGTNSFSTTLRFYRRLTRVDIDTRIVNRERFVRYRMLVPTTVTEGQNFQEIPFGAVTRPTSQELPAQNWIDYGDDRHGVALLNRGNPGNNVAEGELMLSLMRATQIQDYGIGGGFEGQGSESGQELGKTLTFHYAILAHPGTWRDAAVYRAGLEFNNPLLVRKAESHPGKWGKSRGRISINAPNVVLSALKLSRNGETVVRVYEATGKPATGVELKLDGNLNSASEANLMEDEIAKMKVKDGTLRFDLRPFEIKTFKVRLARAR
ncbi:MAG TPA: glycoside hydrolase family 38 C-terminal domain-containing protein [Candidatus Limnocylindria bacterium]|jgi:alpha-mannosidase|nr:glycoside hydrolase family 38 C-terminal domain-containing protein [Candidatus Limnocylindria bacterium]